MNCPPLRVGRSNSFLPVTDVIISEHENGSRCWRREWDLNPRGSRPRLFKSLAFGRSAIPPGYGATLPADLAPQ